jgi:purine nucleosidase
MIRAVIFDFGGVLAEEGFKEGLKAIAKEQGFNPEDFYNITGELVYQTGYVSGTSDEHSYWEAVREKTGVKGDDEVLREEILKRFRLRPEIIEMVDRLKSSGLTVAILSDQTNWLDELNRRAPFYDHFDYVFNSFRLKKTKRDPSVFKDVCALLRVHPEEILFVDDNPENTKRASGQGLRTIHFKGASEFQKEVEKCVGLVAVAKMEKVMIDCDVGVDDALALILAFRSRELDVKAITGVNGNVPLEQVFENIQKVLQLIQPKNKPLIGKGAEHPLKGKTVYAYSVHGKDGLGGAKIDREEEEEWRLFPGRADELITTMARQYPGEITLIATAPLTNLALALQRDREGMGKLKAVAIMGGAVRTKGNITPHAEFNIFSDPLAAKIVLESGLPIRLVPLDVTHQVYLTPQMMEERVKPIRNTFSRFIIEATGYNSTTHQFRDMERFYLHDPLAVGVVIDPALVTKEKLSICVETQEDESYGRTSEAKEGPEIDVCLGVDSQRFLELFVSRLG